MVLLESNQEANDENYEFWTQKLILQGFAQRPTAKHTLTQPSVEKRGLYQFIDIKSWLKRKFV